jgi:Zn-dependent M16 (insulinase) family peptidase
MIPDLEYQIKLNENEKAKLLYEEKKLTLEEKNNIIEISKRLEQNQNKKDNVDILPTLNLVKYF